MQKHVPPGNNRGRVPVASRSTCTFVSWLEDARDEARGREVYLKIPHLRHGVRTRMRKSTSTWHKTNMLRRTSIAGGTKLHVRTVFWMSRIAYAYCPVHPYVRRRVRRQKARLPLPNLLAMPEDRLFIYQTTTKIGRASRRPARVSREPRVSTDHLTANQV